MRLLILLLVISLPVFSQNDLNAKLTEAVGLYNANNYAEALKSFRAATAINEVSGQAMLGQGLCLTELGNYPEARRALTLASWYEPINNDPVKGLSYLELIEKDDLEAAKKWMTRVVRLCDEEKYLPEIVAECDRHLAKGRSASFTTLKAFAESEFNKMQRGKEIAAIFLNFNNCERLALAGKPAEAVPGFDKFFNDVKKLYGAPKETIVQCYQLAANELHGAGDYQTAFRLMQDGYNYYYSNNVNSPFYIGHLAIMLCDYYNSYGQSEEMITVSQRVLQTVMPLQSKVMRGELLMQFLRGASVDSEPRPLAARQEQLNAANELISLADFVPERAAIYRASGYNHLGTVYFLSNGEENRPLAKAAFEKALTLAQQNNLDGMVRTLMGNLALIYFREKQYAKADVTYRQVIDLEKKAGSYDNVMTDYNNLGSMYAFSNKWAAAAPLFEEAVKFSEEMRSKIPAESRAAFIRSQISAYQFLNICNARLANPEKLFSSIERSRGRMLAETISLGAGLSPSSLKEAQASLRPDEAVIMYATAEQSEFAMLVITSTSAQPFYLKDPDFVKRIQGKFAQGYGVAMKLRSQESARVDPFGLETSDETGQVVSVLRSMMTKAPGTEIYAALGGELQKAFYRLLISPAESLIAGKNKLYLLPDSYLSFVPFDALQDANGKYLAEKFVIQYAPSMTVMKLLKGRTYPSTRKPMVAFGGATFAPYTAEGMLIDSEQDFRQLQMKVAQNAKDHKSQRSTLASIGVQGSGWKYLPGTMTEVSEIAKRVAGTDVIIGAAFDEASIKAMSARGELARYRTVHFATHGMVVPTIPELSTVVTTLSLTEKGGEDGFLTVPEARDLKLQADFVALSACETGLGKLYAGEGVIGLTQSFLQAGANAMSVSLWAISDDATMRFMIGLYDLVYNQGKTFPVAMAEMKRKFIRGEFGPQYQDPYFWAPFAYYGE